ncbi:MAG: hypothetical protein EBR82_85910 [Caulobacteraceae bacterium]|nr:hypothetical protein [Caulobacteraceae bacterium]
MITRMRSGQFTASIDGQIIGRFDSWSEANQAIRDARPTGVVTYDFERVTYNGQPGFFATRRVNGVYAGRCFGKSKALAIAAFIDEPRNRGQMAIDLD